MLKLHQIRKCCGTPDRRVIFDNLALELLPGEHVAIIGEPGCGKSTLLNLVAGLELPDSGRIELDGRDITRLDGSCRTRLRRQDIGFVFRSFLLLPYLTVLDNAALTPKLNGMPHRDAQHRAHEELGAVGLEAALHRFPATLSGSESQRVAIARALAHRPKLVLADEPAGNLDTESAIPVLKLLRGRIKARNCIGILVTRSAAAAATADRAYRLRQGFLEPA